MAPQKPGLSKPKDVIVPLPVIPTPGVTTPTLPIITPSSGTLTPVTPSGTTTPKTSTNKAQNEAAKQRLGKEILAGYKDKSFDVGDFKWSKGVKRTIPRLTKELKSVGEIALNVPKDMVNFFGGIAVDAQRVTDPRIAYSDSYRDWLYNDYMPNSTTNKQIIATKDTLQFWDVIPEYLQAWDEGQAVTPLLLRDFGNLSIVAGGLKGGFKAAGAKAAEKGNAATAASRAGGLADEAGIAAAEAYTQRMNRINKQMDRAAGISNRVYNVSNEVGMIPFKPWMWTGSKLGLAKRNGVYVEGLGGWGAKAAQGYISEIQTLRAAEPDILPTDPRLKTLREKAAKNLRMSLSHATKAKIRQAVRNQQHEADLVQKALLNVQKSPKYVDDINPVTGEKWGELSLAENEAVIAVLNGRANLVAWLVENLGMSPERVSVLGRYDATPEYYLSETGARLSYDMMTGMMDDVQYERLSDAILRVGRVIRDTTQRAVEGYGRRSALSPDYLKPIPFWNKLRAAVYGTKNKALIEMVDGIDEVQRQIDEGEIELDADQLEKFKKIKDEVSVNIIEQLPDEIALDPDLYPASMRENIEFYRRVRRSLNQGVVARAEGEPLPPRDGGPRAPTKPWDPFDREEPVVREEGFDMPKRRGKLTAAEGMIGRVRKNIADIKELVIKITDKIAKLEEKQVVIVERLRKYDVVEAYIAGKDTKWIAKKFRLSVGEVETILKNSPLRKQFDAMETIRLQMEELQSTIGVKRSRLRGPEADAELLAMQAELAVLQNERQVLAQTLQAAKNINEIARQADESAVDRLTEEQDKLEDDLFDAETEFENAGGDTESFHQAIDPTDTDAMPVDLDTGFQMVMSIQFITDQIAPILEQADAAPLADAMTRVSKMLELALNDADDFYTNAQTPARRRVGDLRVQQLGNLLATITTRINEIMTDPPEGMTTEMAIATEINSIISTPETQAIIAGTAPLSSRVGKKKTTGTGEAFGVMAEAGFWDDIDGPADTPSQGLGFYKQGARYKDVDTYLDAVIEEFSNSQNFAALQDVSYAGNTAKVVKTIEILARWAQEVRNAGNDAARIELILNPPDYVPEVLAKKLLQGTSRDPARIRTLSPDDVTHPMDKFVRKVVDRMDSLIYSVHVTNAHVRQFGTASFLDWNKFKSSRVMRDWSGQQKEVAITAPSVPNEGVVPRLRFDTSTPVEAVIEAVDRLIESIKNDEGANPRIYEDLEAGYKVSVDGLTKGKAKYKNAVIKDLEKIRNELEKAKKLTPDEATKLLVEEDLLPGVVPDETTAAGAPSKLTPVETLPKPGQNTRADYVIIPCGNAKLGKAAAAADFYTGSMFRDALATARQMFSDDRIFVMSAKHGLVTLDTVLEPYDLKLGDPKSIDAERVGVQIGDLGIENNIMSLLPNDYHKLLEDAAALDVFNEGDARAPLNIERVYEGTRGIGEQKARLSQLRKDNPAVIAEDAPGSAVLPDDMEQMVFKAVDDPAFYDELVSKQEEALAYDRDMQKVLNPTKQEIEAFKAETLKAIEDEITSFNGFAESNLGALWLRENNTARFWLTPVKGMPEWDWWYALPAKTRQRLARDFFYSEARLKPAKEGSTRSAWRSERKTQGIDEIADEAGMTVDEWADAFLDFTKRVQNARSRQKETKATPIDEIATEYTRINLEEMNRYKDEVGDMTPDQYDQVIKRIEYIKAEETGDVPANLRPIAKSPEDVVPDPLIADPTVRQAAYAVDVVDAMAKDAANKMRRAERMTARVQAFEEFVAAAKKYEEASAKFEKTRLGRVKVEQALLRNQEAQRKLREQREAALKLGKRLKKVETSINVSTDMEQIRLMRGSVPLEVAMQGEYPSSQLSIDIPAAEGGVESFTMQGPMYVPTGKPRGFTGMLKTEQLRRGLEGFNTLTSEHYRDGDRHTIFSIRQLAVRMSREAGQMTANEAYKIIVAEFGDEAVSILSEDVSLSLYEKAYEKVSSMPLVEQLRLGYKGTIKEQIYLDPDAEMPSPEALDRMADEYVSRPIEGTAAYSQGVPDPALAFNLALKEEFGRLVSEEMEYRGYVAVDPFKKITAGIPYSKVTHKTMFLPSGLREMITKVETISDPNTWSQMEKAAFKVTGAMKTTTLVFSVSWQLGDLISNVMLAAMSGKDVSVRDIVSRMREVKQKEYGPGLRAIWDPRAEAPIPTPDILLAQEAPIQDIGASQAERRYIYGIPEGAEKAPLLTRLTGKEYPQAVQGRGVTKVAFKINETINRLSRHAYFLELLDNALAERNLTINDIAETWRSDPTLRKLVFEVADTANDFLGDFADLSLAERKLVGLGVPFYSWAKHIHRVTMLIGRDNPAALRWYFYLGAVNFDPDEDPFGLRYGAMELFGGAVSTNLLNPFGDVFSGPIADILATGDVRTALGTLGPVPRLVSAGLLGQDISKLQGISRPAGTGMYTESGQAMPTPLALRPTEFAGYAAQQFPVVQRLLNILPEGQVPGTSIATGPVSRYGTGEARLRPGTRQTVRRPGGQLAALGRIFSLPGIPYQGEEQLQDVERAARARLRSINAMRRLRSSRTGQEFTPVGP